MNKCWTLRLGLKCSMSMTMSMPVAMPCPWAWEWQWLPCPPAICAFALDGNLVKTLYFLSTWVVLGSSGPWAWSTSCHMPQFPYAMARHFNKMRCLGRSARTKIRSRFNAVTITEISLTFCFAVCFIGCFRSFSSALTAPLKAVS